MIETLHQVHFFPIAWLRTPTMGRFGCRGEISDRVFF
jgi:hypothetical protein